MEQEPLARQPTASPQITVVIFMAAQTPRSVAGRPCMARGQRLIFQLATLSTGAYCLILMSPLK